MQCFQRVSQCLTGGHGDQNAVLALTHVTQLDRTIVTESTGHDAGTRGHGQESVTETDQTTCWNVVLQTDTTLAIRNHVGQITLTQTHLFHDRTLMLVFDVDDDIFIGLMLFAVNFLDHNFWTRNAQLKAFATHGFDQYRQVQLTTT